MCISLTWYCCCSSISSSQIHTRILYMYLYLVYWYVRIYVCIRIWMHIRICILVYVADDLTAAAPRCANLQYTQVCYMCICIQYARTYYVCIRIWLHTRINLILYVADDLTAAAPRFAHFQMNTSILYKYRVAKTHRIP